MQNQDAALPSRGANISLREVTKDTVRQICELTVAEGQRKFVATNAESMAQAYFHPEAWFRAVYADETPVGFVMIEDPTLVSGPDTEEPVCLWRFMMDHRYQGLGFGKRTLELVVKHVRTRTKLDHMLTSCVPGDEGPRNFYLKFGFLPTGEVDDHEIVLRLDFESDDDEAE
jgi:diamine N-acetyltransferase